MTDKRVEKPAEPELLAEAQDTLRQRMRVVEMATQNIVAAEAVMPEDSSQTGSSALPNRTDVDQTPSQTNSDQATVAAQQKVNQAFQNTEVA